MHSMQMFKFAILQVVPARILPKAGQLSPCQLTLRASQVSQQLDRFLSVTVTISSASVMRQTNVLSGNALSLSCKRACET